MKKTAILLLTALISLSGYSQKIKGSDNERGKLQQVLWKLPYHKY